MEDPAIKELIEEFQRQQAVIRKALPKLRDKTLISTVLSAQDLLLVIIVQQRIMIEILKHNLN